MKNLMCKWFNLVRKEELESSEKKTLERDLFIIEMSKDLDAEKFRVLYSGESMTNIWFDGKIYILGEYVSVISCNVDTIVVAPGCEKIYLGGISHFKSSINIPSGCSILGKDK